MMLLINHFIYIIVGYMKNGKVRAIFCISKLMVGEKPSTKSNMFVIDRIMVHQVQGIMEKMEMIQKLILLIRNG